MKPDSSVAYTVQPGSSEWHQLMASRLRGPRICPV